MSKTPCSHPVVHQHSTETSMWYVCTTCKHPVDSIQVHPLVRMGLTTIQEAPRHYATIGPYGVHTIVYGYGDTKANALTNATTMHDPLLNLPAKDFKVVEVTPDQLAHIKAGVINCRNLGINLK